MKCTHVEKKGYIITQPTNRQGDDGAKRQWDYSGKALNELFRNSSIQKSQQYTHLKPSEIAPSIQTQVRKSTPTKKVPCLSQFL